MMMMTMITDYESSQERVDLQFQSEIPKMCLDHMWRYSLHVVLKSTRYCLRLKVCWTRNKQLIKYYNSVKFRDVSLDSI